MSGMSITPVMQLFSSLPLFVQFQIQTGHQSKYTELLILLYAST